MTLQIIRFHEMRRKHYRGEPRPEDLYVSQCKLCGWQVSKTQQWAWSQDPIGIVHVSCEREPACVGA